MKKIINPRLNKYMLKLSDYAIQKGISYRTAYNHFRRGLIPNAIQMDSGAIYINENSVVKEDDIWINLTEMLREQGYIIRKDETCI